MYRNKATSDNCVPDQRSKRLSLHATNITSPQWKTFIVFSSVHLSSLYFAKGTKLKENIWFVLFLPFLGYFSTRFTTKTWQRNWFYLHCAGVGGIFSSLHFSFTSSVWVFIEALQMRDLCWITKCFRKLKPSIRSKVDQGFEHNFSQTKILPRRDGAQQHHVQIIKRKIYIT